MSSTNYCHLQSAYCYGHSMETTLVKVINDILVRIDEGKVAALVSHDISLHSTWWDKITGKVEVRVLRLRQRPPEDRLIACMQELYYLRWFIHLEQMHLQCWVRQASVLGPILFSVRITNRPPDNKFWCVLPQIRQWHPAVHCNVAFDGCRPRSSG